MKPAANKLSHTAWVMAAIAALAQNAAMGLNFGSYSTFIAAMELRYETTRTLSSAGLGAMVLSMALWSPVVGTLLRKYSLRTIMIIGAALSGTGYALMTQVENAWVMLAVYAIFMGTGACFLGILPAATLVSRWFVRDRGKALGIINMPLFLFFLSPVFGNLLPRIGMNNVFLLISVLFFAVIAILLFIVDEPQKIGLKARGADDPDMQKAAAATPAKQLTRRDYLGMRKFWLLSLGIGITTSGGTVVVTHFVPFGVGRGFAIEEASLFISAFGGAGIFGALFFGWVIDKVGAVNALILNTLAHAVLWLGLYPMLSLPLTIALAASIGICAGSVAAVHGGAINELFGAHNFSEAMGLSYLLKLPFIVGAAPLAGWIFHKTGSYNLAFTLQIATFLLAGLMYWLVKPRGQRSDGAPSRSASESAAGVNS